MALSTISLCAGVGGLDLGLDEGARRAGLGGAGAICYVEGEAFAAACLVRAMEEGSLAQAPIWSDLRTFDARPWRGKVDCVVGGYPCQGFSQAARGRNTHPNMWPEFARIIGECAPRVLFLENVAIHLHNGFREVVRDLQDMGYDVAACVSRADAVGAPHKRRRLFALAVHANTYSESQRDGTKHAKVASTQSDEDIPESTWAHIWPFIPGMDDGTTYGMDRSRAAGNAVVPAQAAAAFVELYDALRGH